MLLDDAQSLKMLSNVTLNAQSLSRGSEQLFVKKKAILFKRLKRTDDTNNRYLIFQSNG